MARFSYNGSGADPTDSNSYTLGSVTCSGNQKLCSIEADNNGSDKPVITDELIAEMLVAVVTNTATSTVALKN